MTTEGAGDQPKEAPKPSNTASFLVTLATNVGMMAISIGTGIAEAHLLGPRGLGQLVAIQMVPMLVGSFGLLGIPNAAGYFSAREPRAARSICLTGIATGLVAACITVPLAYWLLPAALSRHDADIIHMSRIYLVFIPLQIVQGLPAWCIYGCGRFKLWNTLRLLPTFSWVLAIIVAIVARRADPGFVASAYLVFYGLTIPVNLVALYSVTERSTDVDPPRAGPLLRYGIPVALGSIPAILNVRLDQLLMVALVPAEAVGFYGTASSWAGGLNPILTAVGSVLFPAIASSRDLARRTDLLQRSLRVSILAALFLGMALAVATPVAMPLVFGRRFAPAVQAAIVLIACNAFISVGGVMEESLRGLGAPRWPLASQLAGLPITLGLMFLLLPKYQATGAAISALIGGVVVFLILAVGIVRVGQVDRKDAFVPRATDVGLVYGVVQRVVAQRMSK
jgi:O-antigen/teichoic acid export membrane protein